MTPSESHERPANRSASDAHAADDPLAPAQPLLTTLTVPTPEPCGLLPVGNGFTRVALVRRRR